MKKIVLTSLLMLGLSTAAFAQAPSTFADVDTDASGELSFVELQVAWPDLSQEEFDAADIDVSGGLSAAELNSLQPTAVPTPAAGASDLSTTPQSMVDTNDGSDDDMTDGEGEGEGEGEDDGTSPN